MDGLTVAIVTPEAQRWALLIVIIALTVLIVVSLLWLVGASDRPSSAMTGVRWQNLGRACASRKA